MINTFGFSSLAEYSPVILPSKASRLQIKCSDPISGCSRMTQDAPGRVYSDARQVLGLWCLRDSVVWNNAPSPQLGRLGYRGLICSKRTRGPLAPLITLGAAFVSRKRTLSNPYDNSYCRLSEFQCLLYSIDGRVILSRRVPLSRQ